MSVDPRRDKDVTPPEGQEADLTPIEMAADLALRQALLAMPVPEPAPDFDEKVLSAVRGRSLFWGLFLSYLRPALATASASAAITLLLVHVTAKPPRPVHAADLPLSARAEIRAEEAGAARMRRALESDAPTYAALQPLRDATARPKHPRPVPKGSGS